MYPAEYTSQIPITNMNMRDGPGRTYRFYTGEPVYPFGYGLSYTTFNYTSAVLTSTNVALTTALRTPLTFDVTVENTGRRDSHHVVLGMISSPAPNAVSVSGRGTRRQKTCADCSVDRGREGGGGGGLRFAAPQVAVCVQEHLFARGGALDRFSDPERQGGASAPAPLRSGSHVAVE